MKPCGSTFLRKRPCKRRSRDNQRAAAGKFTDAAGVRRLQVGWEYVHVCIDDATRLAYVEVLCDEKATTAIGFLHRAVKHFASYGITVERLITDNGSAWGVG